MMFKTVVSKCSVHWPHSWILVRNAGSLALPHELWPLHCERVPLGDPNSAVQGHHQKH